MWPFRKEITEATTIVLTPKELSCCSFTGTSIKAYQRIPLKNLEHTQSIIFNQTALKNHITNFLVENSIQSKQVALAITGPSFLEDIVQSNTSSPDPDALFPANNKNMQLQSLYLCPSQKKGYDFFICGMKPEHLFSYHILSMLCSITFSTILPEKLVHLYLYKHLEGDSFRQTKLSLDLMEKQYNPYELCQEHILEQALHFNENLGIRFTTEKRFLATHLGLFLHNKEHE